MGKEEKRWVSGVESRERVKCDLPIQVYAAHRHQILSSLTTSSLPSFLLSLSLFLSTSFPSAVFLDLFTLDARSTAHFDRSFLPLLPLVPLRISGTCRHIWCRSSRSESYLSPSSGSTTDPLSRWWILFPSIIALAVRFTTQARLRLSLRAHGSPSR